MSSVPPNPPPGPPLPPDAREEKRSITTSNSRSFKQNGVLTAPVPARDAIPEALRVIQDNIQNIRDINEQYGVRLNKDGKEEIKAEKEFKPYEKLQDQGLKAYEYFSKNKDNILRLVQRFVPQYSEWADFWLNKSDNAGKWSGPVTLTFLHLYKYFSIWSNQKQLKRDQRICETYIQYRADLLRSSAEVSTFVREFQETIVRLNYDLNEQREEAYTKGIKPFGNLFTKMLVLPLEMAKVSEKVAAKISKSAYSLFKSFVVLWSWHESDSLQKRDFQYLQSRITVKVFESSQPEKTRQKSISAQERLSTKEEGFEKTLLACKTIEEVQAELKRIGHAYFKLPTNIEEFKQSLTHNRDFRHQLFERYNHSKIQDDLTSNVEVFLDSLSACETIEDIQAKLKDIHCSFNIPVDIEEFKRLLDGSPRFRYQLVESYYHFKGQRMTANDNNFIELLNTKRKERDKKIKQYMHTLALDITKCRSLTFAEIKTYFANLHINIDCTPMANRGDLTLPPTTLVEWDACIQNEEFLKALAGQWVDFQETSAQLLLQATRQALLSKHHVEKKFLFFRALRHTIEIFSNITQMVFSLCNFKTGLLAQVSYVVEIWTKDIPKLGSPWLGIMYIFHPLYAQRFNLKLENFCILLAKHFFAIRYKPNEYSFESYQLEVKAYLLTFMAWCHYLFFQVKQAALWMNIRLIENCVMRFKKQPLAEDKRYESLAKEYADYEKIYKDREKQLKQKLEALKIKDASLIVSPTLKSVDGTHQDVFQMMQDALNDMNIDYFSSELQVFFEDNLGLKLANDNKKQFREHLQELMIESEVDFIQRHASNRFHHLKGQPRRAAVHNTV